MPIAELNDIARNLLTQTPPEVVETSARITGGAASSVYLIAELLQAAYGISPEDVPGYLIISGALREFERIGLSPLAQQLMAEEARP